MRISLRRPKVVFENKIFVCSLDWPYFVACD
jgi:hypothetical protein